MTSNRNGLLRERSFFIGGGGLVQMEDAFIKLSMAHPCTLIISSDPPPSNDFLPSDPPSK